VGFDRLDLWLFVVELRSDVSLDLDVSLAVFSVFLELKSDVVVFNEDGIDPVWILLRFSYDFNVFKRL
jgi:hypothetical protein